MRNHQLFLASGPSSAGRVNENRAGIRPKLANGAHEVRDRGKKKSLVVFGHPSCYVGPVF
jgi:hypothetical protein